jgi:LCP family protein required for cell wall assembly
MRRAKKIKAAPSSQDKEFERLYRTIPPSYNSNPLFDAQTGRAKPGKGASGKKQQKPPQPRWKKILKRALIVLAIILLLAGLWVGWKFIANGVKIFGWGGLKDIFTSKELRGEDRGRVNILLAGNSSDDPGHGGAELTDSIMVVSINTKDNKGYILSIPRDLYIDIPGHGYAKINEAYQDGERSNFREPGYAKGGMGLLQKTIGEQLDMKFHYYALVNYAALKQGVNAVGGVTITVDSSDPRGLYDPSPDLLNNYKPLVDLPNGKVKLNGTQALGLARARGNSYGAYGFGTSDFARTEHQRQLLLGLKSKAASASTLTNPVKIGKLFDSIGNNVETDFEISEVRRLYELMKRIPNSRIKSASLNDANGVNLLQSYRTNSGQSALAPAAGLDNYTAIKKYLNSL